ncbi:hypothetical protein F5X96DRAFT_467462 [Biscogniauxia mediterranea]|nr:hypothetical protein F5X96DRAFT_467462 [Biscogniauxia mediterranea]
MASHYYPLNGVDLDFRRYMHRPLGGRDILVNRIMDDYMNPRRVKANTYLQRVDKHYKFHSFKSQDHQLGLDLQVLQELLETDTRLKSSIVVTMVSGSSESVVEFTVRGLNSWPTFQALILDLIQRHFMETGPALSYFFKFGHDSGYIPRPVPPPRWKEDMVAHLKQFQTAAAVHYQNSLVSGYHQLPLRSFEGRVFSIDPCFLALPKERAALLWPINLSNTKVRRKGYIEMSLDMTNITYRRGPRRPHSLPPPDSWFTATLRWVQNVAAGDDYYLYSPRQPLSKLDKLSRRRSLSRTHIQAMFHDPPEWHITDLPPEIRASQVQHACTNCAQYTHLTKDCPFRCGYCDSSAHKARNCTIKAVNRCKCRPFPQHHTASRCFVPCSRKCGSPYPQSHFKHKAAIMCAHRCCMCGVKGHTGRKCALKRCPCGGQHLTQDCRWKVECPARGCDRYLCSLHCRECGERKGSRNDFVGGICQGCLKNGTPVSAKAE